MEPAVAQGASGEGLRGHVRVDAHSGRGLDVLLGRGLAPLAHAVVQASAPAPAPDVGMLWHVLRVCECTRHVPSLYVLGEMLERAGDAVPSEDLTHMLHMLAEERAWGAGALALVQWGVHARVAWNWASVHKTLRESGVDAMQHVGRLMTSALDGLSDAHWPTDAHTHDVLMQRMGTQLMWDVEWSPDAAYPAEVLCSHDGVDVAQPFRLDETGANLYKLVACGSVPQMEAALAQCSAIDDEEASFANKEPRERTPRVRLAELCVLLDRPHMLQLLCARDDGERVCTWRNGKTLECYPLTMAAECGRSACMRALVQTRVLATYMAAADDVRALVEHLASSRMHDENEEDRATALYTLLEGAVGGGADTVDPVPPRAEEESKSKLRKLVSRQVIVDAATNGHVELCRALVRVSKSVGDRSIIEHPSFRYLTAKSGHVGVLRALEEEGIMYGAPTTCREACIGVGLGDKNDGWGDCMFTWACLCVVCPGCSVIGFICDACGNNVPALRHGMPMLGARRSGSEEAVEWMRQTQMQVPITQTF